MAFIDATVVNVALPTLQATFHATVVDVQWVVESYGLFLSSLILAGGALGDLFGRRRVFLVGVGIFAAASAACGLAPNIRALVIARCMQGLGAALLVPGSLAIISASFEEKSRGQAIGIWTGFTAITTAIGPVLGGFLIQYASWRWAFFLNLPLAAAVVVISFWRVPESGGSRAESLDWLGALLATASLGGMVTGCLESGRFGWRNPLVFGSLLGGLLLFVLFLIVEARAPSPMVSLALFKSRAFLGANLLTLFLYAAIGIFFFLFPMTLIQLHGYSPTATGAAVLPLILLMFSLSRWSVGLVTRYGRRAPLIAGPLVVAIGFALFALIPVEASYWKTFLPASLVLGFGMAVTVAPLTTVVMSSVGTDHVGAASGINNAVARVAGVLAIAVFGLVMVTTFRSHLERSLTAVPLSYDVVQYIRAKEIELANIQLPPGLDSYATSAVRRAISAAFLASVRLVLLCCAALAAASAIVASLLISSADPPTSGAKMAKK
jgi:EmrB/QacA subfamily drug resistance transporter